MNLDDFMVTEADGTLHVDIPRFLRATGHADTPANRDTATRLFAKVSREVWPGIEVTEDPSPMPPRPRGCA